MKKNKRKILRFILQQIIAFIIMTIIFFSIILALHILDFIFKDNVILLFLFLIIEITFIMIKVINENN